MVIDTLDCVAKLRTFNLPSFPTDFRRTMCSAPVISEEQAATNAALHANTIKEIDAVIAHVTAKGNSCQEVADDTQHSDKILNN